MAKRTFTIDAHYNGKLWGIACEEAGCYSSVKRLSQIDDDMREAIAYQMGLDEDDFEIVVNATLPQEFYDHREREQVLLDKASQARQEAARENRQAALALRNTGLSLRDIGAIMGISHQRVAQLATP